MLAATLATPRGIDFRSDTNTGEAWIRLQDADPSLRADVLVLTDPHRDGVLTGFVSVADLKAAAARRGAAVGAANPAASVLSELPMNYRPVIRSHEVLTDVAKLMLGHGLRHLPVVDAEGVYLGEILRSEVSEALMRMLGFDRTAKGSMIVLQTADTSDPLKQIMASADSAGVRVLGFSELWHGQEGDAEEGDSEAGAAAVSSAVSSTGQAPGDVRTLLLHLDTRSPEGLLSALRRKGYFPISMTPDSDESDAEMSDRIDQLLHFLTI